MLKLAIVGTGIIVKNHIDAIIKMPDKIKIVAVCDINEEKAKTWGEELSVPYFTDYKDIVANVACDAVLLNLPHGLHCDVSIYFLDAGKHVLVEKPMANTVEECDRMIEAAKRNNKKLAVGHIQRFQASIIYAKEMIESEELGKLCMYSEVRTIDYFLPNRPKWFTDKKMAGGGIVMNYGAHAFDKLYSAIGADIVSIDASCGNIKNDSSVEGHANIFVKYDNGVSAAITFSGYTTLIYEGYYYFTKGALKVLNSKVQINRCDGQGFVDVPLNVDAFKYQIEEFCKYINGEPSITPDGEYGKKIIAAIEEVYSHLS